MKTLLAIVLLLASSGVFAQTCADRLQFSWDAPEGQTLSTEFDGWRLMINADGGDYSQAYAGTELSRTYAQLGLSWSAGTEYCFYVQTYKATTYGNQTTSVRMLDSAGQEIAPAATQCCTFVTSVPSQPTTPVITP